MRIVRNLVVVAFVVAGLSACGRIDPGQLDASVAPQIVFGQPDGADHPWVVTLLFEQNGGFYSCTGTLLSPTLVLTAGHCTEEGGNVNGGTWVTNDPVIDTTDLGAAIHDDTDPIGAVDAWATGNDWVAGQAHPHPGYDDFASFPNTYDVGVVVLTEALPHDPGSYGQLPPIGLLDTLLTGKNHRDRQFTAVGYGMQGLIPPIYQDDWERYVGTTTLINVNSMWTGDEQSAGFTSNPGKGNGSGGTCFGDSGGPLFLGDTHVVGAVVSFGFTPCIGIDYNFRVDTQDVQDFVTQYLP